MSAAVPKPDFAAAGAAFARLCGTMATLRAPGGCAWDREQTLASLQPYLIEEAYEVIDAIEAQDPQAHCEELGDLLLQVVFQAEIAADQGDFNIAAVVTGLDAKLRRRHPHVFAGAQAADAGAALQQWERIKASERSADKGRLSGVPRSLPSLLRAYRMGEKAAASGFDWPNSDACEAKFHEEWQELQAARDSGDAAAMADEMGDVLMALTSLCRHLKIDPEAALAGSTRKFQRRFAHIEARLRSSEQSFEQVGLDRLNALWDEAKALEEDAAPLA